MPFSGPSITQQLINLYQLRSDCVHGKQIAWSLRNELKEKFVDDVVYEYEFLAEMAARDILKFAMFEKRIWENLNKREDIEEAWALGKFDSV